MAEINEILSKITLTSDEINLVKTAAKTIIGFKSLETIDLEKLQPIFEILFSKIDEPSVIKLQVMIFKFIWQKAKNSMSKLVIAIAKQKNTSIFKILCDDIERWRLISCFKSLHPERIELYRILIWHRDEEMLRMLQDQTGYRLDFLPISAKTLWDSFSNFLPIWEVNLTNEFESIIKRYFEENGKDSTSGNRWNYPISTNYSELVKLASGLEILLESEKVSLTSIINWFWKFFVDPCEDQIVRDFAEIIRAFASIIGLMTKEANVNKYAEELLNFSPEGVNRVLLFPAKEHAQSLTAYGFLLAGKTGLATKTLEKYPLQFCHSDTLGMIITSSNLPSLKWILSQNIKGTWLESNLYSTLYTVIQHGLDKLYFKIREWIESGELNPSITIAHFNDTSNRISQSIVWQPETRVAAKTLLKELWSERVVKKPGDNIGRIILTRFWVLTDEIIEIIAKRSDFVENGWDQIFKEEILCEERVKFLLSHKYQVTKLEKQEDIIGQTSLKRKSDNNILSPNCNSVVNIPKVIKPNN